MSDIFPGSIEDLLEHRAFIRRLVRRLVADEATVDDILQRTWMAALRSEQPRSAKMGAWLASIARRLVYRSHRERTR